MKVIDQNKKSPGQRIRMGSDWNASEKTGSGSDVQSEVDNIRWETTEYD
jgi:hypothetical protein